MSILSKYISELPVGAVAESVNSRLCDAGRLVVTAPPGSGKSTLLPLTILQSMEQGRIVMLEPRRVAARQIAMRMAAMLGEKPGESVGYRMRFESRVSEATRIEVVTEGVMERMLIDDPTLDGIDVVIFDEFHERSLTADLSLALTLEAQNVVRPDLKVVLMSATIDTAEICRSLNAENIEAEGRMHEVKVVNCDDIDISDCVPAVAATVSRSCREHQGNILAFLPGQGEIERCAELIKSAGLDAVVLPLYGLQSAEEQRRAIEYNPSGGRKIVLATPVAETSLTIEGVTVVVDSGLCRAVRHDPAIGLSRLVTERVSLDMARQRAGRAGRLSAGVCYRLWSKATEHRMKEQRDAEIMSADLSGMVLDIAAWGSGDPMELPWLTPPPKGHMADATRLLSMLGALDAKGMITTHGRKMAALPCHPRIANMLLKSADRGMQPLAADIAAVLEEKDPLSSEEDADIATRVAILREKRSRKAEGKWRRIASIAAQYRRLAGCREDNSPVDPYDIGMLVASAYPVRVAMRTSDRIYRLPNGETVRLGDNDDLEGCEFLAVASMGKRVFLAAPVSKAALKEMASSYENVSWSSREGRVVARRELRMGILVIDSSVICDPDREKIAEAVCQAVRKEGRSLLDFTDDVERLQLRVATVAQWHPELDLPDVSAEALMASAADWLPLYAGNAMSAAELRKIDLCAVIAGLVGYDGMQTIDRLAPSHIELPCGRRAKIDYRVGSEHPVVSARLQDCLGLLDTPRVDAGKRPVLMELLSPGFKPVQLTQDLRGFWSNTYFEVRKELRRRYPKHRWPDNPLEYTPQPKS